MGTTRGDRKKGIRTRGKGARGKGTNGENKEEIDIGLEKGTIGERAREQEGNEHDKQNTPRYRRRRRIKNWEQ